MPKNVIIDFAKITIDHQLMIVEVNKGEHLTPTHHELLEEVARIYFGDTPFIYITHRKNSYSVDPVIYKKTSQIKNLLGFAVVADVPLAKANAEVEKLFLNKPFEIFQTLEDALNWAKTLLDSKEKNITSI
jgi:hypothetical protein